MKNNNEVSSVIKSAKKVAIGAGVVSGVAAFSGIVRWASIRQKNYPRIGQTWKWS